VGNVLYSVMMEKSDEWLFTLITRYIEVKSKPRERDQSWSKVSIEENP
jgi:hypothetical protein